MLYFLLAYAVSRAFQFLADFNFFYWQFGIDFVCEKQNMPGYIIPAYDKSNYLQL